MAARKIAEPLAEAKPCGPAQWRIVSVHGGGLNGVG
jgi:hypothetical protein